MSFDKTNTGLISEAQFRKIMRSKESVDEEDINEMIEEYKKMQIVDGVTSPQRMKNLSSYIKIS